MQPSTPNKLYDEDSESHNDNVNFRNAITHTLVSGSFKVIAKQKKFGKNIKTVLDALDSSSVSAHVVKAVETYQRNPKSSNNFVRASIIIFKNVRATSKDVLFVWK